MRDVKDEGPKPGPPGREVLVKVVVEVEVGEPFSLGRSSSQSSGEIHRHPNRVIRNFPTAIVV